MRWLIALFWLILPMSVAAQGEAARPAVLVADQLYITQDRVLVARGNVEAFQGTTRLRATSISYNGATGALDIVGPIVITEGENNDTIVLANAAQLDANLRTGLLTGARLVLNQRLQLAAVQIDRVEGGYSQLYKTAVTSCKVCKDGEPPLWQIRAKRVIHDQVGQQLYFDQATFYIKNVPVFYLPRLRLPDPTQNRASGFLLPSVRSTSQLGVGVKVPYFFKIGRSRDLTVTPYLSSKTKTLELRYRQAFRTGRIEFNGAFTRDDLFPDEQRGYLFGVGTFDLRRDYKLTFAIQSVSDEAYFTDYGYSDLDRLKSELTVSRTRRDEYIRSSLINFESLRANEVNETLPNLILDGEYEKRMFPRALGGELRLGIEAHSHRRRSDLSVDGPDPDLIVDGRDVARLNASVEWQRRFTLRNGLVTDVRAGSTFNFFDVTQDNTVPQNYTQVAPFAAVTLSYPMVRRGAAGVVQTLAPVAQIGWVGGDRLLVPNEESTRVEFDAGNLMSLSHFPRPDRRERGTVGAVGLTWARLNPAGWDTYLTFGQVFRSDADPAFSDTSGLSATSSNVLLAGQIANDAGMSVTARTLVAGDLNISKAELRGDWTFDRGSLGGSYIWLQDDAQEERPAAISELTLAGSYDVSRHWIASANVRYDLEADRAATAGLGMTYNNECVTVDLSVRRRYTSSTSVEPSTDIGFNIGLRGFSAETGTERYVRSCGN